MKAVFIAPLLLGLAVAATATDLLGDGNYIQAYEAASEAKDPLTASEAALAQTLYRNVNDRLWIDRAIDAARDSVHAQPNNPKAYLLLGRALGEKAGASGLSFSAFQLSREARANMEKSVALNAKYADGEITLARWHAGAYARAGRLSGGNPDIARKLVIRALEDEAKSPFVVIHAGLLYLDLKDTARAKALLEQGLALNPRHAQDKDLQAQARAALTKVK